MEPNVLFQFYDEFCIKFANELEKLNIGILSDFLSNKEQMQNFYHKHIKPNSPRIVICGINPAKNGAGKTGIPFLDFNSLSKIMPDINRYDHEKSADFIYSVIDHFGINIFFKYFYLTNISCIGFFDIKTKENVNYYDLPIKMQLFLFDKFSNDMNIINPKIIIPLGKEVEKNLILDLKHEHKIKTEIGERLFHPSYKHAKKDDYINLLERYKNI